MTLSIRERWRNRRVWLRGWRLWLSIVVAFLVSIYLSIYLALNSDAFSRFLLVKVNEQVPQLEFSNAQGNLSRGITFGLRYRDAETSVVVESVELDLQLLCLWRLSLCVDELNFTTIDVNLPKSESEPVTNDEIVLPEISIPLRISLQSVNAERIRVNSGADSIVELSSLFLRASWFGSQINVRELSVHEQNCLLDLSGEIHLAYDYPIVANLSCREISPVEDVEQIDVTVKGDLAQLNIDASVIGNWPLAITAQLQPLQKQLPFNAEITLKQAIQGVPGEPRLTLARASATVAGKLDDMSMAVEAEFSHELLASGDQASHVNLQAQLLLPQSQLTINELELQLPSGTVQTNGQLNFADTLSWQGDIDWQSIGLSQFHPSLNGDISGRGATQVSWQADDLSAQLDLLDVSGVVLDKPVSGRGALTWQDQVLAVNQLQLQQNGNAVTIDGLLRQNGNSDLQVELSFNQLNTVLNELGGSLQGQLHVTGTPQKPALVAHVGVNNFRYQDWSVKQGTLTIDWQDGESDSNSANLVVTGIGSQNSTLSDFGVSDFDLNWRGNRNQHGFNFSWRDKQQRRLDWRCNGLFVVSSTGPAGGNSLQEWQANCDQINLGFIADDVEHHWQNSEELALTVQLPNQTTSNQAASDVQVNIEPICFRQDNTQLCSTQAISIRGADVSGIDVRASDIPLKWANRWLPERVTIDGQVQASISGEYRDQRPQLSANIVSQDASALVSNNGKTLPEINFSSLSADWQVQGNNHDVSWTVAAGRHGNSNGELHVLQQALNGEVIIEELQLEAISTLLLSAEDESITGLLNSRIKLEGNLERPRISGMLNIRQGILQTNLVPVPIEQIALDVALNENAADIDGQFKVSNNDGRVDGSFRWQADDWHGDIHLTAEQIVIEPEPRILIHLVPDVSLTINPRKIELTGDVRVPKARIEVKQLPEQAIGVSRDSVIVGQEASASPEEQTIRSQLHILLGNDVQFKGFGLETGVGGDLQLHQEHNDFLRAKGVLKLTDGRYKSFGQNLKIETGDLIFVDDIDNPQLRLEAVREQTEDEVKVGLRATGPAKNPQIEIFSVPSLSQQEQLSYLLTGSAPNAETEEIDPSLLAKQTALSLALESSQNLGITRAAADALGIEDFKVSANSSNEGTDIGLSGYVTPNLMVRYGVGVFDAVNSLTLNYRLTKNVSLEAISGEGTAFDILWSFDRD